MAEPAVVATVVVRSVAGILEADPRRLQERRRSALAAFADKILEPAALPVLAGATAQSQSLAVGARAPRSPSAAAGAAFTDERPPLILSATGSIVVALDRLKPQYRTTNDECWVIVGARARIDRPAAAEDPYAIGLTDACRGGSGVLVGVVDSGFEPADGDGATVSHFGIARLGDDVEEQPTPFDCHHHAGAVPAGGWRHGTRVCARIAGATLGVAPQATLAVAAALTEVSRDGTAWCDVSQVNVALQWLVTADFRRDGSLGCDVINASLSVEPRTDADHDGLRMAFWLAGLNRILLVCAVGASHAYYRSDLGPLAAEPSTLAVGALDGQGRFSGTNRYSPKLRKPEACAPGSSTSFATPLVTGACALLIAADPALRADPQLLKARLIDQHTCSPVTDMPPDLNRGKLCLERVCDEPAAADR